MRPPGGRGPAIDREGWDVVEGPLDDPRVVLAERLIADRSLLDDVEVVYGPDLDADLDLADSMDDESVAERSAEAGRLLITGPEAGEETLTPESLESVLEPYPTATDETLHEVESLLETLLDEGTSLDADDADAFEAEIAGGSWRDNVD